jgi:hypothetical protein
MRFDNFTFQSPFPAVLKQSANLMVRFKIYEHDNGLHQATKQNCRIYKFLLLFSNRMLMCSRVKQAIEKT